jgi:hypothetical protein
MSDQNVQENEAQIPDVPAAEDIEQARYNLTQLASILDSDAPPRKFQRFWNASQGTTASR